METGNLESGRRYHPLDQGGQLNSPAADGSRAGCGGTMTDWQQIHLLPWGRVLGFLKLESSDCRSARLVCTSWANRTLALVDELWLCGKDISDPFKPRMHVAFGKTVHLMRLDGHLAALQALPSLSHLDLSSCAEVQEYEALRNCTLSSLTNLRLRNGCRPALALVRRHAAHLTSLDVCGCNQLSDAGVMELCGLSTLTALNLSGTSVADKGLAALTSLYSLTSLRLQRCYHVGDSGLQTLTPITSLQDLDLQGTPISGQPLQNMTSLTRLNLDFCVGLTTAGLAGLQHLTGLTDLNLDQCEVSLSSEVLRELVDMCTLDISGNNVTDTQLSGIWPMTSLSSLNLRYGLLSDAGLASLRLAKGLTKLDLSHNAQMTDAGLSFLNGLPLQHLELSFCSRITAIGLSSLSRLAPSLNYLSLAGCTWVDDKATASLSVLTSLTTLDLRFLDISSPGLAALRPLHHLATLLLQHNRAVTTVPSLPSLTHLDLEGCQNLGAAHSGGCTWLWPCGQATSLNLAGCSQLPATSLDELWRLGSLTCLNLACCKDITDRTLQTGVAFLTRLAVLDLGGCSRVTDSGLDAMHGCTSLRQLSLSWCSQISDSGLAGLSDLPLLKDLDLSGCTRLTGPGILNTVTAIRRLIKIRILKTSLSEDVLLALRHVIPSVVWSDT